MSIRPAIVLLVCMSFLTNPLDAQYATFHETFDSSTGFTSTDATGASVDFFSDGSDSYFGISEGTGMGDFGGDPPPTGLGFSSDDGGLLALEDLDEQGMSLPLTLRWEGIDISSLTDLKVEALVAAFSNQGGFDSGDFLRVAVAIDGGAMQTLAEYRVGTSSLYQLRLDTDGDGVGDGSRLTPIFPPNIAPSWSIDGTGTTLDVEVQIQLDDKGDSVAIDDLMVTGIRRIEWLPAGADDFHEAGNWSLAVVPGATDDAIIRNGGTAVLDASVAGAPSSMELRRFWAGDHLSGGHFEIVGVDLQVFDKFRVDNIAGVDAPESGTRDTLSSGVVRDADELFIDDDLNVASPRASGSASVMSATTLLLENITEIDVDDDIEISEPVARDSGIAVASANVVIRDIDLLECGDKFEIADGIPVNHTGVGRATVAYNLSVLIEDVTKLDIDNEISVVENLADADEAVVAVVDVTLRNIPRMLVDDEFLMPEIQTIDGVGPGAASNHLDIELVMENTSIEVEERVEWSSVKVIEDAGIDSVITVSMTDTSFQTHDEVEIGNLSGGGGTADNRLHSEVSMVRALFEADGDITSGVVSDHTPGSHDSALILDEASALFAEDLILGTGSRLRLHIDGAGSVLDGAVGDPDSYSAIEVETAELNGSITAIFDISPTAGTHSFDLLVTGGPSSLSEGAVTFEVEGLDPGFTVEFFGVVEDAGVDRVRLTVSGMPSADLNIIHTDGQAQVVPGLATTYLMQVGNAGPGDAMGARVENALLEMSDCSWTCVADAGAACAESGTGAIDELVDLPAGGLVTFQISCLVSPGAVGVLSNTAEVTPAAGTADPVSADNVATDTSNLMPMVDLSISNDDGVVVYSPGEILVYTITAQNHGPSHARDARVLDVFPAQLTTCQWECSATGGAFCALGPYEGDIDQIVDLPVGGGVTFTAACAVSTGTDMPNEPMVNQATVTAAAGVTELLPADNLAVDVDEIVSAAIFVDGFESGDLSHWSASLPVADSEP